MTANEILAWFGYSQGTATKSDIRRIWHSLPDYGTSPEHVESKFKQIGVDTQEGENDEHAEH